MKKVSEKSPTPSVSVIIPAFNSAETIKRAIDSVVAQTFRNFEVIVVDDGSSDDTSIVATNSGCDNLRLLCHENNRGPAAARNTGINAASGQYIAFLDSDDVWHSEKIAQQVRALENATVNVKGCVTGYRLFKGGQNFVICPNIPPGRFQDELLFGCTISPGTTFLVDRSAFDVVGLFDENIRRLEDWDWFLSFVRYYDLVFIPAPLATIYVSIPEIKPISDDDDPVIQSIRQIEFKHAVTIGQRSQLSLRQFRSTLMVEIAAHMYRRRKVLRAIGYTIASLCIYPFRNRSFYISLWRSLLALTHPRKSC